MTLAAGKDGGLQWPVRSLAPVRDYHDRVSSDCLPESEPDGDCPVTGALCYARRRFVPIYWMHLFDAVERLNASGRVRAAFLAFPPPRGSVSIRLWPLKQGKPSGSPRDIQVMGARDHVQKIVAEMESLCG